MNPQGMVEWRVALDGTYVHAESRFDGTGSAELLIPLDIAEGLGPEDYAPGMRPGQA